MAKKIAKKKVPTKTRVDVKQDLFQIYRDIIAAEAACVKVREQLERVFGKSNQTFIVPISMSLWTETKG